MAKKPIPLVAIVVLCLAVLSCNFSSGQGVEGLAATLAALSLTQTAQAGVTGTAPAVPASPVPASPVPPTACSPTVTANLNANVRNGPGTVYDPVGNLLTGQTATVAGKSADGTWWYINFPAAAGGYGWISASTVTATCLPVTVAVIPAPPLPPTSTPVPVVFAVTHVGFTLTTTTQGSYHDCPLMTAHIKTNAAGDVTYHWTRSDGASAPSETIHFGSAGTQDVQESWFLGSVWNGTSHWLGIYIDSPNNEDFGNKTFTSACSSP